MVISLNYTGSIKLQRAHKIRLYPTKEQQVQLLKTAGTTRYAYNWALAQWVDMYEAWNNDHSLEKPSAFKLSARWTKEKPEWAKELSCGAQQRAILNVGTAFQNLWRGTGRYPTFHKKGRKDSFYVKNTDGRFYGDRLRLPNIGRVKLAEKIRFEGKIMSYTVSHYAGQWYVSVQVETSKDVKHTCSSTDSVVGIDVGLSHVAVASDGTVCEAPASLKLLDAKLRNAQRSIDRKQKGSNNRRKALLRKQRIQSRINNIRQDVTHKFTTTITKNHGIVVTEDLKIQEMKDKAEFKSLRRAFSSSMMGMILWQLSYKAQRHIKVDKFFPSTKLCSSCGSKKDTISLSERTYVCEHCGAVIDRDVNAAINLMNAGAVSPEVLVNSSPR